MWRLANFFIHLMPALPLFLITLYLRNITVDVTTYEGIPSSFSLRTPYHLEDTLFVDSTSGNIALGPQLMYREVPPLSLHICNTSILNVLKANDCIRYVSIIIILSGRHTALAH